MQKQLYKEAPVLLLSYQEGTREFKLSEEGKALLTSLDSPIAIVGVAGLYRTGKSYLLNRVLLDRKGGFGVGPTVNPCTKGIWIWGSPIPGRTFDGKDCNVIILDTEGIGALDQDSDHDSRIFSLTVLIVSCFIYNSVGSIDEEALNNLSLVVNLTKHIQIKSKNNEEVGTEEYAPYFPSFMWVVRDFALRLVDSEGEVLTPKEYLEKALNTQKGFSDLAEEKNRIRRLLKEFFKDRDCCTLVRPVSNEEDLHTLEEIPQNLLRPEFIEQTNALRVKVLRSVKPKTLNARALNGEMLVALIESYVHAVNKGAVPNIENAWNYICKNECAKALEDAQAIYTAKIQELLVDNFPNFSEEILGLHKGARRKCYDFFKAKALGEESQRVYLKLKEIIDEKYQQLKFQNEVEAEKQSLEFLRINYSGIHSKLRSGDYKTFLDFEREIRTLQQYFKEHGPKGPFREVTMLNFCQAKIIDASDIFMKHLFSEIEIIESTTAEKIKVIQSDANAFKEEIIKERGELGKKIVVVENEKKELVAKDTALQDQINALKIEKDRIENELRGIIKQIKEETAIEITKANGKVTMFEERAKEIERKSIEQISDFNEKCALFDQKINFLENSLEESKKKEKDLAAENKNLSKTHASAIKEIQQKLETQIKLLENKLEDETENRVRIEKELEEIESRNEKEIQSKDDMILKLQKRLDEAIQNTKSVTQTLDQKERDFATKLSECERTYEDTIQKLTRKLDESERKSRKTEESLKSETNHLQKENAILTQKVEFLETQCQDYKFQLDEERKQHAAMLLSLSSISDSSKHLELELEQLKEKHANELKYIESQNEQTRRDLLNEIDKITKAKTQTELHYKLDSSEWAQKQESLNEELTLACQDREKLRDLVADLKRRLEAVDLANEAKLKARVAELEAQISEMSDSYAAELQGQKNNAEKSYAELKEFYETEKKRFEVKLAEERDKGDKKYRKAVEEYEERIKQETEALEEEIANKEQEVRDLEVFMNEEITALKQQASLDNQKIESLEMFIKENKDQIEVMQRLNHQAIEQYQEKFNQERTALMNKNEQLTSEISSKDRELSIITYKKEQTDAQLLSKTEETKEAKAEIDNQKIIFLKKIDELKQSNKTLSDDLVEIKSDFKREAALAQQEIEFKAIRIAELERSLKDTEEKYRDALKVLRTDGGQDLSGIVEKLSNEKETIEKKLLEKKKTHNQLQGGFNKQIAELEKEKAIMSERLLNAESRLGEIEYKHTAEREQLLAQVQEKQAADENSINSLIEENERLKIQIEELQHLLSDKAAIMEREKILYENKFNFLTQQRDSAKSDLYDAQSKFQFSLEQLHKRELSGKEKQDIAMNSLISSIESRYASQLKDLQESSASTIEQLTLKVRLMDQEIMSLKEEVEIQRRGKGLFSGNIDQRCRSLQEIEAKLLVEIENLTKEKNKRTEEFREGSGFDKGHLKNKINEVEKRLREAEQQRGQMYLELEKERSKWQIERDHLFSAKNEALEMVEKVEKKREAALREVEKLKSEKSKNRPMLPKRSEHQKTSSSFISPHRKMNEMYSQRVEELDSASHDSPLLERRRSFAD